MGLPNVQTLEKIFDDYLLSLNHQSGSKKNGSRLWNSVKTALGFGKGNPYIEKDPEQTKRERIDHFKTQFKEASSLPNDRAVISWRKLLDIFHDEYKLVIAAEIFNESKFGFAIRAASSEICKAIFDQPLIQAEIKLCQTKLKDLQDSIRKSINSASTPIQSEVDERNDILLKLTKLGDKDAAHEAARLSILPTDKNHKPDEHQFTLPPTSNAHVVNDAEIYPGLPWAYQPNLLKLYEYRLENHEFPPSISTWEKWKREQVQKKIDAENAAAQKIIADRIAAERSIEERKMAETMAKQKAEQDAMNALKADQAAAESFIQTHSKMASSSSATILEQLPAVAAASAASALVEEGTELKAETETNPKSTSSFLNATTKTKGRRGRHVDTDEQEPTRNSGMVL